MPILHMVQAGDTISSIAEQYQIPVNRLMEDNDLTPRDKLNIGQIIIIIYPKLTYTVKPGDTLYDIAQANGVSIMELLRNNPSLSNRDYLEVGEELIISYDNKEKKIEINGMAFSFINEQILKKTLPFLTYITVMGYQVDEQGNLLDIDDTLIIQMAIDYGVVPLMLVYSLDESRNGTPEVSHVLLNNPELQDVFMNNIINTLRTKGYYGAICGFQYILEEDLPKYTAFIKYASMRLQEAGFLCGSVLLPSTFGYVEGQPISHSYFAEIGQVNDGVILLTYQWATGYVPELNQTAYSYLKEYLDAVVAQIPPEKIYLGISRIAYEWELPYVENESVATSLTTPRALALASQYNSEILFDELTQFSYFFYNFADVDHVVWFRDARYANAMLRLVDEYGIGGISVWNIMIYYTIWVLINSQYDIQKLLPVE